MTFAMLAVAVLAASPAASQTAGFTSDGSAYAGMKPQGSGTNSAPSAAPQPTSRQQDQLTNVVGGVAGSVLGGILTAPAPAPYVHTAPKPVVGDDDESTAGPSGSSDAQDIIKNYHPDEPGRTPFDRDASFTRLREYVKKKVKYSHDSCDPTGKSDMLTGVDCSCLMLHGNPDYYKKKNGEYARTADEQHALMIENKDDSLTATELKKGDVLFLRNNINNPKASIAHTGLVTDVETCDKCGGCSADNGDVCLTMLHAPRSGKTVTEANTTLHNDKDKNGNAVFCIHKRDGTISQCLTGGGRFP